MHSNISGKGSWKIFAGSDKGFVVVYGTSTLSNKEGLFNPDLSTHTHEETDIQIPIQVLDATAMSTSIRDIYVWSLDTYVFLFLIDLVATCTIHGNVKITNCAEDNSTEQLTSRKDEL